MKNEKKYVNLVSDIFIFIIGVVLTKVIQFVLMPLYTSFMSTDAYGVAELINSISELLYPIATLCIYEAAFRYAVDPNYENKQLATIITKLMALSFLIGASITAVGYYLYNFKYALYLFFIVYAYSLRNCAAYYVRGCGFSKNFALSGVVNAIALAGFSIVFIVFLNIEIEGYLLSIALAYCVSALYLILTSRLTNNIELKRYHLNEISVMLRYSIPLIPYNILYWVTMISERYILLYLTDASTAGIYVAAIKIGAVINMVQSAVYSAFQLNSARMFNDDDKETYYNTVNNSLTALYFAFGALIICFTPILASITLRKEFGIARQYLPLIMMTAIFNCISSLVGTMYTTYKKTNKMIPVSVIGALSNLFFSFLLIPIIGIWGACFASAISYLLQLIYKMFDTSYAFKLKYNWKMFLINLLLLSTQVLFASFNVSIFYVFSVIVAILLFIFNGKIYKKQIKRGIKFCGGLLITRH